jgi:hypothetical protein
MNAEALLSTGRHSRNNSQWQGAIFPVRITFPNFDAIACDFLSTSGLKRKQQITPKHGI